MLHLSGGPNKREGRVEVSVHGDLGTVCDDEFDINDVTVICKFLGFPWATTAYGKGQFEQGYGFIWFDNLHCTGHESTPILLSS